MHDDAKVPEQRSLAARLLRPKVALPLTLLVLALLSPLIIRGWNLSRIADLDEPALPPRAPSIATPEDDTALHHFRLAVEKSVEPYYEVAPFVDTEEVIPHLFRPQLLNSRLLLPMNLSTSDTSNTLSIQQVLELIQQNEEALREWSAAAGKPFEPTGEMLQFLTQEDHLPRLWFLFSLSILRSEWLQSEGRLDEAWNVWLFAYQYHRFQSWLARTGLIKPPTRGVYNGELSDAWTIERFARLVSSPDATAELSQRMLSDLDTVRELAAADLDWLVQQSYERTRQRILDYYASVSARQEAAEAGSAVDAGSSVAGESSMKLYIRGEPEISLRVLKHHDTWLRLWFAGEGRFCPTYSSFPYQHAASIHSSSLPRDLMTPAQIEEAYHTRAVCLREVGIESQAWAVERNSRELKHEWLRVFVAAQWFTRTQGALPRSIEELVPGYLPTHPVDPFDPNGQLLGLTRRNFWSNPEWNTDFPGYPGESRFHSYFEEIFKQTESP